MPIIDHNKPASYDSLLDILTCLQGALMFMILITGIDAAQTKLTLPTPIEVSGNERPVFIECRDNALYLVPLAEVRQAIKSRQMELLKLRRENPGSPALGNLEERSDIKVGAYIVDFNRYMSGQIALMPRKDDAARSTDTEYKMADLLSGEENSRFFNFLASINREEERLSFAVRDDSFEVFKKARMMAWKKNIKVTYTLVPHGDPLIF